MNKAQFLQSLSEVWCRLAVTKYGVGVVAIRDIPEGIDPFKNCDQRGGVIEITEKELAASDAPEEAKQLVRDFCALQNGVHFVPDYGIDSIDKSYFLNHSTTPNMITLDAGESFITDCVIKKGEELSVDYEMYHEYVKTFRKRESKK